MTEDIPPELELRPVSDRGRRRGPSASGTAAALRRKAFLAAVMVVSLVVTALVLHGRPGTSAAADEPVTTGAVAPVPAPAPDRGLVGVQEQPVRG